MGKIKEYIENHKSLIRQFLKFMLVGCLNFLVDLGILLLLNKVLGLYSVYANIISYSCGVINSYFFNRMWTFKTRLRYLSTDFLKFIFVNLISLAVSTLAIYILVERFMIPLWIGKIISTFFSFTVNFAGNKLLVFKDEKKTE